jgi:hypothetical protein
MPVATVRAKALRHLGVPTPLHQQTGLATGVVTKIRKFAERVLLFEFGDKSNDRLGLTTRSL